MTNSRDFNSGCDWLVIFVFIVIVVVLGAVL